MADKDKTDPSSTSHAYDVMAPRWAKMETVLGGTEAMRAAGELYLPRHEKETDDNYQRRLGTAVFYNVVEKTLGELVGKPFREGLQPGEDLPEQFVQDIFPDLDLQGNDAEVFAKQWFREGVAKGFAHVMVERPRTGPRPDGKPRTLEDDRREGVRPYWVFIKPECVLFASAETVNGRERLTHVRLMESYTVRDGFAEVVKPRIRVLEPGLVELWEPTKQKRNGKPIWRRTDFWETGLTDIPLVTFYAEREDLMVAKPPLADLADLNIAHWQSDADQRHILRVTRFPMLAVSGADEEDDGKKVVVGPNRILKTTEPTGKWYFVEHTGASITAGADDLKALEERMSTYGAQFLQDRPGDKTATEVAVDTANSTSILSNWVDKFTDAFAQALQFTAEWMKLEEGGTVDLSKDFHEAETDTVGIDALNSARERRDISREAYLKQYMARGILPEDFDPAADAELLAEEMSELMGATGMDLNPGAPAGGGGPGGTPAPSPSPTPSPAPSPARRA